jgi:hypothetical protein
VVVAWGVAVVGWQWRVWIGRVIAIILSGGKLKIGALLTEIESMAITPPKKKKKIQKYKKKKKKIEIEWQWHGEWQWLGGSGGYGLVVSLRSF